MQRREFVVAGASVIGATSIGAVAFTEASVTRDVSVDIVADDAGPIQLTAGATNAVTLTNGLLTIDTNTANANGLNGNGTFTYGNDTAGIDSTDGAANVHAFSMANKGGGSRDFTFGLANFSLGGSSSIQLSLYDDTTLVGDVSTSSDATATLGSGDTLYAVLTFDTSGLTDGANMNGDLTIDATSP